MGSGRPVVCSWCLDAQGGAGREGGRRAWLSAGVMSQGEVNALALSLFLLRARLPSSPFRFLVIDDPALVT